MLELLPPLLEVVPTVGVDGLNRQLGPIGELHRAAMKMAKWPVGTAMREAGQKNKKLRWTSGSVCSEDSKMLLLFLGGGHKTCERGKTHLHHG